MSVERSAQRGAVFLSYASQDAEAARRICDALRAAGIEVWFDQSELRGGDAWDQKIRRQIRECALFVPIISANTQARAEGYFRLEWRLADHRTHLMGKAKAFLVPVCIDGTRDSHADVPDSFVAVQWIRLPGGEPSEALCSRVQALLERGTGVSPVISERGRDTGATPAGEAPALRRRAAIWPWWVLAAVAIGAVVIWQPWRAAEKSPAAITPPSTAVASSGFPRDPELKRAMDLINGTEANTEDFALAEEIARNALAKNSTDPEAVIVMARVQVAYLFRGFDRADERHAAARRYAERAFQLASNDPEAVGVLGVYHLQRSGDLERARELLNRAIALKPGEPFFHRHRDNALFIDPKVPAGEALASAEKTAALFPADALSHYELARHYRDVGRVADFERELDRTIAVVPLANAIVWKARIALWMRGDVAEMKALIDRVPARVRSIERVVFSRWVHAVVSGSYDAGQAAVTNLTSGWVEDFDYVGPKALLSAQLFELEGKRELARLQYEAALAEVQSRQARTPGAANLRALEAWILHGLGRSEDARRLHRVSLETIARPYRFARMADWWFTAIPAGLLFGDRATALELIREAIDPTNTAQARRRVVDNEIGVASEPAADARAALRLRFQFDPRVARLRDDPEIAALLKESPPKTSSAAPVDQKSVAVLAFANLSDDRANEYFSDGISEELLNVLAKVPGLRVAARTSAFYFKGKNATAQEIGQKLGVAHLVDGSVRKVGPKVRIVARLSKAETGEQIWGESYEKELKDVFALQDEIARDIAGKLRLTLGAAGVRREVNPEAHRLVLEGRHFWSLRTEEGFDRAERAFARAVQLDPQFARAHAGLADLWAIRGWYHTERGLADAPTLLAQAETASRRTLEIDPELAEVHATFGAAHLVLGRIAEAEQAIERCLAAAPNYATAHNWHGDLMLVRGRLDLALEDFLLAARLDPLSPIMLTDCARALRDARRFGEALEFAERCLALSPELPTAIVLRAQALLELGRRGEALAAMRAFAAMPGSAEAPGIITVRAVHVLRQGGDHDEAGRLAAGAFGRLAPDSFFHGFLLAALGRYDEALPFLARSPKITFARTFWDPAFDLLREHPGFHQVLKKLGCAEEYKIARETLARMQREQEVKK